MRTKSNSSGNTMFIYYVDTQHTYVDMHVFKFLPKCDFQQVLAKLCICLHICKYAILFTLSNNINILHVMQQKRIHTCSFRRRRSNIILYVDCLK